MRLVALRLQHYRVYDALELEIPPGIVGIYGPNGAGKSTLLESVQWCLFGRSRTAKGDIRTAGVDDECFAELDFEHEGHHYRVRRSITGRSATVKARLWTGPAVAADGPTEVNRYVRSVLGMDDQAFRSSVFAEQKQLSAFSDQSPEQRRRLVLALLGITPIERARDRARGDARRARADHDRLVGLLPDLGARRAGVDDAVARLSRVAASAKPLERAAAATATAVAELAARVDAEAERAARYEHVRSTGQAVREQRDRVRARHDALGTELAALRTRVEVLPALAAVAAGAARHERQATLLAAVDDASAALRRELAALRGGAGSGAGVALVAAADPEQLQARAAAADTAAARATEAAADARAAMGVAEHASRAAEAAHTAAQAALQGKAALSAEEPCPTCGQALGDAFAQLQRHRRADAARAADAARLAKSAQREAVRAAQAADAAANAARRDAEAARAAVTAVQGALARVDAARARAAEAVVALADACATAPVARPSSRRRGADDPLDAAAGAVAPDGDAGRSDAPEAALTELVRRLSSPGHVPAPRDLAPHLAEAVEQRDRARAAGTELARLEAAAAELDRRSAEHAALASELAALDTRRRTLLAEIEALAFRPDAHAALRAQHAQAVTSAEGARQALETHRIETARAEESLLAARAALADAQRQADVLAELEQTARTLQRTADLLHGFRQHVVAAIGPALQVEASSLFAALTGGEYDGLLVDGDTYAMQVVDQGQAFSLDRFSGSEVDLANLSLRVAISEHIRFQSGGQLGLLVLDEALASLDADRKDRMLGALTNLGGRFGQILVVTHAPEVKEQLPSAIEVVKRPGRRATARIVEA